MRPSNLLMTGGFTPRSYDTASLMKPPSTIKPCSTSPTLNLPQLKHPNFNPLLSWKQHDFPTKFCIWQHPVTSQQMLGHVEHGSKDMDIHTKEGCDVINLTVDSSSNDEKLQRS